MPANTMADTQNTFAEAEVIQLQVNLRCDRHCEVCSKYFSCTSSLRQRTLESPALRRIRERMATVKHKIAVMSGKGGVGKSTTTANLAGALTLLGARVGIVDSDFYGPSIPIMMGLAEDQKFRVGHEGIKPVISSHGIAVASVASASGETEAVTWVGEQLRWALYEFLGSTVWGDLDFLLVDLPPGTGEETSNVMKAIQDLDGGVIVTIPSGVSQIVVGRGIDLCHKAHTRVLGLIENMGTLHCPACEQNVDVFSRGGGKRIADRMQVPFLGTLPLDERVAEASDTGTPFVMKYPDSPAARSFMDMARQIAAAVEFSVAS